MQMNEGERLASKQEVSLLTISRPLCLWTFPQIGNKRRRLASKGELQVLRKVTIRKELAIIDLPFPVIDNKSLGSNNLSLKTILVNFHNF